MSLLQRLERLLFGYTAEEAVEICRRWVQGVIDQRIASALAEDESAAADDDDGGKGGAA